MTLIRTLLHNRKSISWLLVIAVVLLSVLPSQMHLHHENAEQGHGHGHATEHGKHVLDIHTISNLSDHNEHDNVTVMSATPDSLVKKVSAAPVLVATLIGFFIFLIIAASYCKPIQRSRHYLRHFYLNFRPPLRAPPIF